MPTRLGLETEPIGEHGMHWYLMADPDGNEFCICDGGYC